MRKKVLYLDQFFFSRAFRMKDPAQDSVASPLDVMRARMAAGEA